MLTFTTRRLIRMSDADIHGNVHNLSIIRYAEDTAVEWVHALRDELGLQTYWGVARVQAEFTRLLPWTTQEVQLALRAEKVGRASLNLVTSISSRLGEHAQVRTRVMRFDASGTRTTMTPEERAWYQRYLAQDSAHLDAARVLQPS
ncbi:thioesterase family protein [Streptomyces exfoliatus]|uniref:thioesterase family protein n=1 Tax=Streptomyces exfoliatus TaxID=1905 RepID=UPI003C2FA56F